MSICDPMKEQLRNTDSNSLVSRVIKSVRRKGVIATLRAAKLFVNIRASEWGDHGFDLKNQTETAGIIETANLQVTSVHKNRGVRYQPTRARPFRRLMSILHIPQDQVFVDIGSGKGRVLLMALDFGFKKIVGVEYAPELCEVARKNLNVWRRQHEYLAPVEIHCCDASEYDFKEGETVIYLFNPFDALVLTKLLQRLAESLRIEPRKIWLIYCFPRWHDVIASHGMFAQLGIYIYGGYEFAVYTYDPNLFTDAERGCEAASVTCDA